MVFADVLFDTSWTIQYVQRPEPRLTSLNALFDNLIDQNDVSQQLQGLSEELLEYLLSRSRAEPEDELNDRTEKTGQLRECVISPIHHLVQNDATLPQRPIGLLIETRYQKMIYQVILLSASGTQENKSPASLILFKGNIGHIKNVKNWLDLKFALPPASQLQVPSLLLLQAFSEYLVMLTSSLPQSVDYLDALRQAMLKQVIGNLKMTIAFTGVAGSEVASQLKTLDFDIPAETVNVLLDRAQKHNERGVLGFLDELTKALHERTGLKLPLTAERHVTSDAGEVISEPPLKITKITCAAFAFSVEGKIKFASRPVETAEMIGYESKEVRKANQRVLDLLCQEADKLCAGQG